MDIKILYEDQDVFVIDKPHGVIVNRSATAHHETIQDWAEGKLKYLDVKGKTDIESDFINRGGLAHRLDKDTSGCLIIAKHPQALEHLLSKFKNRTIHKEYIALVHGAVSPSNGTVSAPVGRLPWRRGLFGVMPGGKHAVTHYKLSQKYFRDKNFYSLLNLTIETGRTHQIRVHLQYTRHPVVGDVFYAGKKRTRKACAWCPRLFLHSSKIVFTQPSNNKSITVHSPLPAELVDVLEKLVKI